MRHLYPAVISCVVAISVATASPDGLFAPVLAKNEFGGSPGDQMDKYLQDQIDDAWVRWKAAYETRTDPSEIRKYYDGLREKMVDAIGGFPERTALNARVTGALHREGYRVEKVIFESQPGIYVTAALFLPDASKFTPPYPGVLVPCGHYAPAKAHGEYQSVGALIALNGMAALVFDPIDQGERNQTLDENGKPLYWGTEAHTRLAIRASLLGLSAARFEIWDGMRAIDYLQSRPEVDPQQIGCTGNSGGGTQTSYLMAIDDRIKAAAPSCYIQYLASQTLFATGDGEQHIYGQLAFGLDIPDYLMMRAPTPIKVLAATHDFFHIESTWEAFRFALRDYTRLGASEKMEIMENDAGHNYNRTQREAAVAWMSRWLLGRDIDVHEPELQLFSEEEMRCTPRGQVLLLPGARSVQSLLAEEADRLSEVRRATWPKLDSEQQRTVVRQTARFTTSGKLPAREWVPAWTLRRDGYTAQAFRVKDPEGVVLPAVLLTPDHPGSEPAVVFAAAGGFHAATAPGARLDKLARAGRVVLAIDLRGTGETKQDNQRGASAAIGTDWKDMCKAYLLGRPYVGMQVDDIFATVLALRERTARSDVDLITVGEIGVSALHAAFAEPALFHHVTIEHSLRSWDEVVHAPRFYQQFMNAVPGALEVYDLPDLVEALGDRATIVDSTDALGWSEKENGPAADPSNLEPDRPGLTGIFYGSPNFSNPQAADSLVTGELAWPEATLNRGNDWSVRWRGFLAPEVSGNLTLGIDSSENAVIRADGRVVANSAPGSATVAGDVECKAGHPLSLDVELIKPGTNPTPADNTIRMHLKWKRGDAPWQAVPATWLRHSRQQEFELEHLLR